MKNRSTILLSLIVFIACETPLKDDLGLNDYEPEVAVTGALAPGYPPAIQVTMSKPILAGTNYEVLGDAEVLLITTDGSYSLDYEGDIGYTTDLDITPSTHYKIEVNVAGFDRLTGSDETPSQVMVKDFVKTDTINVTELGEPVSHLRFTLADEANEINFYEIILYQIYEGFIEVLPIRSTSPSIENIGGTDIIGSSFTDYYSKFIINDNLFDGDDFTFDLDFLKVEKDAPIYVHIKSVSDIYHEYLLKGFSAQENKDNPFSEPQTVTGNIKGGQGIFVGYTVHEEKI